ncbi:MAG: heparin lyase I family protein, partial [Hyphomicrobiaceae bacterium]
MNHIFARTVGLVVFFMGWAVAANPARVSESIHLSDDFESQALSPDNWWLGQARTEKYWVDRTISRRGQHAVAIQASPDMRGCGNNCQRNEIRTSTSHRIQFGREAWYSFSFRIEGDLPVAKNTRWISGQWKQDTDGSPFLSQRFDRGVFHLSVHDEDCRVLIAKAGGDLEDIGTTIDTGKIDKHAFHANKQTYRCDTDLIVEPGKNPILPDPYRNWVDMTYRVRGGLGGTGLIEVWANKRFIVRVRGSIGYREVSGPNQFFKFGIYRDLMPGTTTVYF